MEMYFSAIFGQNGPFWVIFFGGGSGSKFTVTLKKVKPFRPKGPPEILDHHAIPLITIFHFSRLQSRAGILQEARRALQWSQLKISKTLRR